MAPCWVFEPWVWEDNANTREAAEQLVQDYLLRDIPVGSVLIDSPWETDYNTFVWDTDRYPQPQEMITNFHARNIRVILWITGFVNVGSPSHDYVKANNYGVNDSRDSEWWKGLGIHIDFTNQAAKDWWHSNMDGVLEQGIDGWKVDQSADNLSDPVKTSIGYLDKVEFKKYYYADFFDYSLSRNAQIAILARPYSYQGGIGSSISKQTVGWSGDFAGDFIGLEAQKNDVYESAQRGYGAPGVEVGGYWNKPPTKNSLIRYTQFAALSPLMENGGSNGGLKEHLPWYWDAQTVDIYRYFATLHSELVPYLFSYGVEANLTGKSILRETNKSASNHKLGEEIFVSAITSPGQIKLVKFPTGAKWIDYWNDTQTFEGGSSWSYDSPIERYPIFLKAGAIIPMNVKSDVTGHGDASSVGKTTVLIYPYGVSSFAFHRPIGDGIERSDVLFTVNETQGTISVDGNRLVPYRFRVKSFAAPKVVNGADKWSYDPGSGLVLIDKQGQDFTITITGLVGYSEPGHETETASPPSKTPTNWISSTSTPSPTASQTTKPEWTATETTLSTTDTSTPTASQTTKPEWTATETALNTTDPSTPTASQTTKPEWTATETTLSTTDPSMPTITRTPQFPKQGIYIPLVMMNYRSPSAVEMDSDVPKSPFLGTAMGWAIAILTVNLVLAVWLFKR